MLISYYDNLFGKFSSFAQLITKTQSIRQYFILIKLMKFTALTKKVTVFVIAKCIYTDN